MLIIGKIIPQAPVHFICVHERNLVEHRAESPGPGQLDETRTGFVGANPDNGFSTSGMHPVQTVLLRQRAPHLAASGHGNQTIVFQAKLCTPQAVKPQASD